MRIFINSLLAITFVAGLSLVGPLSVQAGVSEDIIRTAGADRYETNAKTSEAAFIADKSAAAAVVASGENYPDALSGVSLAKTVGGPLLLTQKDTIPPVVLAELKRVLDAGKKVYVLGGTSVISTGVVALLVGNGFDVVRLAGADRLTTSTAIAAKVDEKRGLVVDQAFLAYGYGFADALAVGPYAAKDKKVVLLNEKSKLSDAVKDYLATNTDIKKVTIVGGTAVIEDAVATTLTGMGLTVDRKAGPNRYATAREIGDDFVVAGTKPTGIGISTGDGFADALGAGALLAKKSWPLLLAQKDEIACLATGDYLADNEIAIGSGFMFGGTAVLSVDVEATAEGLIGGTITPSCAI